MIRNESGSILLSFSFLVPIIFISILASIFFRYSLETHFDQKQLCRRTIVKHHWIAAKASQSLINTNVRIQKLRAKIALEVAQLGLSPSPAHKAKAMIRLGKLRKKIAEISEKRQKLSGCRATQRN